MRRPAPPTTTKPPLSAARIEPGRQSDLSLLGMTLAGLAALLLAAAAGGQSPAAPAAAFAGEVGVTEVLLDALVTDRDGSVILGLGPGDFRVTEEGRPVALSGVAFYSNRRYLDAAGAAKLGVDSGAVPDRRYFVLFFDDQSGHNLDAPGVLQRQLRAGQDAERWLAAGLEPGDLVAVASFDYKLKLHADFTADRTALAAAVRAAIRGEEGRLDWPARRTVAGDAPSLAATLPAGEALRDATPRIYDALRVLADAAAAIPGRKNLLFYSIGFGDVERLGGLPQGRYVRDQRFYPPMMQALNGANVAVYSVDLTPPERGNDFQDALQDIAADTGGRLFYHLQGFARPLEEVARETNGYYLLAYRSERPAGSSGYQKVEVALANPEFRITARRGYRFGG